MRVERKGGGVGGFLASYIALDGNSRLSAFILLLRTICNFSGKKNSFNKVRNVGIAQMNTRTHGVRVQKERYILKVEVEVPSMYVWCYRCSRDA